MPDSNKSKPKPSLTAWLWLIVSVYISAVLTVVPMPTHEWWQHIVPPTAIGNAPLAIIGATFIVAVALLCKWLAKKEKSSSTTLLIVSLVLLVTHIVVLYGYHFDTDWDVQQLIGAATAMAESGDIGPYKFYFAENPNNIFLCRIFTFLLFVSGPLWGGMTHPFLILMVQAVMAWLSGLMVYQTVMHLWQRHYLATTAYILFILLALASPWWSIPYSDAWAFALLTLMVWMATAAPFKQMRHRLAVIALTTVLGYFIKPQLVFYSGALAMMLVTRPTKQAKQLFPTLRKSTIAVVAALLIVLATNYSGPFAMHSRAAMGMTHFMLMGANEKALGMYSADDVDFSRQYHRKSERHRAEVQEIKLRYKELGIGGTLRHWSRKTYLNYCDGTHYWGKEGAFYKKIPEKDNALSRATRSLYYNRPSYSSAHVVWANMATALWLGSQLLSMVAALVLAVPALRRRVELHGSEEERPAAMRSQQARNVAALMLALVFVFLFHLLFEARARYLFAFMPLYIILAMQGVEMLTSRKRSL